MTMNVKPKISISTHASNVQAKTDLPFMQEMVRVDGMGQQLRTYRSEAWEAYKKLPLPDTKMEAWRRTDIHSLDLSAFKLASMNGSSERVALPEELLAPLADEAHGGQIVLSPDAISQTLDDDLSKRGVIFTDLRSAEAHHKDVLDKIIGSSISYDEGKFAALAAALSQNGVFLYVPKGVRVDKPLHSILWGPGKNLAFITHLVVWLEEGSEVTYIHEDASPTETEGQSMHAGLVEVFAGPESKLRFVELQSWGEHVWNFSHERVKVDRDATVEWIFASLGSHLTKNFLNLDLTGKGSTGRMSGFYFTDHDQHLDHDTQQNHYAPNTTSDLLFKGALLGESRSVWQGMIYVAPDAMKTDGYQANRNLVLSRKARADSIPGLEILANDVRCTHGATVGKIDPDESFYLQSRGIPKRDAEQLIVEGFFDPIMQRIPFAGVRARFQAAIHEKMVSYLG
jgi:Fe-S cluster assembly protein SufD